MKTSLLFLVAAVALVPVALTANWFGPQIQNVQDYSSNPFWTPGGPYNQQVIPTPIFVRGPQLGAAECQSAVASAIWTQCQFRNNCAGLRAEDIRHGVIMELSNRRDANYVGACAAFIEPMFEQFRQQTAGMVRQTGFPAPTRPLNMSQPGPATAGAWSYHNQLPQHELDQEMRQRQMDTLRQQNEPRPQMFVAQMPMTFDDLSFVERMEITREGFQHAAVGQYQQFAGHNRTGMGFDLESDEQMAQRQTLEATAQAMAEQARLDAQRLREKVAEGLTPEFCRRWPRDEDCMELQARRDAEQQARDQRAREVAEREERERPEREARERELAERAEAAARTQAQRDMANAIIERLTRD